jgi:CO dehydrogenase/acetyl-CoA synthase gamma subunit (corrinoid Fe-S protein)
MTINNSMPEIEETTSNLKLTDRWIHFMIRIGINRSAFKVKPGLYKLGQPTANSAVFVSANYALSFDALRSSLTGIDCFILVLDTKGINVWCAAAMIYAALTGKKEATCGKTESS